MQCQAVVYVCSFCRSGAVAVWCVQRRMAPDVFSFHSATPWRWLRAAPSSGDEASLVLGISALRYFAEIFVYFGNKTSLIHHGASYVCRVKWPLLHASASSSSSPGCVLVSALQAMVFAERYEHSACFAARRPRRHSAACHSDGHSSGRGPS